MLTRKKKMYALFITSSKKETIARFQCTLLNGKGVCKVGDDSPIEGILNGDKRLRVMWEFSGLTDNENCSGEEQESRNIFRDSCSVAKYSFTGCIDSLELGSMVAPEGLTYYKEKDIEIKLHIHSAFYTASFQSSAWLCTMFDIKFDGMVEMYKRSYLKKAKERLLQPGDTIPFHSKKNTDLVGIIHLHEKSENENWKASIYYGSPGEKIQTGDILITQDEREFDDYTAKFEHDLATVINLSQ